MRVWRAFRGSVLGAAIITAVLWGLGLALTAWPAGDGSPAGQEQLPALSPTGLEQAFFVLAIITTFLVVLTVIVAYSLLRPRRARDRSGLRGR